jgi:hypothetical protein
LLQYRALYRRLLGDQDLMAEQARYDAHDQGDSQHDHSSTHKCLLPDFRSG